MGKPRPFTYTEENLREIAFPLGGIGTGCISLEGRGSLRDWEIYGRPNKGSFMRHTFPVLWLKEEGGEPRALVVQGPRQRGFQGEQGNFWSFGHGQFFEQADGLPCFDSCEFTGTFPTATIRFQKKNLPLSVELEAYSPFIPLQVRDSEFPVAVLRYRIANKSKKPVELTLAWSVLNPIGEGVSSTEQAPDKAFAEFREEAGLRGLVFGNEKFLKGDSHNGTFAITTDWKETTRTERWLESGWFDSFQDFWNRFRSTGELEGQKETVKGNRMPATLGLKAKLKAGESVELPFALSWCFPTSTRYWGGEGKADPWTPHYATQWPDAWAAATEFWKREKELTTKTTTFSKALHETTLPEEVVESLSATLSTFRTPTCLILEDGTFWAWEGCSPKDGCCAGTCSHVWNYATAHAWLFPQIARSIRETEYAYGFNCGAEGAKGAINFRIPIPLNQESKLWHAASDGQLGGIMQLYRDWRITGDESTLKKLWPGAKKALEYAWVQWDRIQDGLVDGDIMHNTYDINFQGPNPLTQFMYLGALKAAAEIAEHLGEKESAGHYKELFVRGKARAEKELWNGEYFVQTTDCTKEDAPKYQHGLGCLSDQLFGQLLAKIAGLGDVVDNAKAKTALKAIYKYNFKHPLGDHENLQRVYALHDESGLILCTWPNGSRPKFPFPYSDEVWTGIEYQVAAHLAFEGFTAESRSILKGIRQRYDGRRRNPYNEFECGSHYARALASWSVFLAFSGFRHDSVAGETSIRPQALTKEKYRGFYCDGKAWGTVRVENGKSNFEPVAG